MKKELISKDVQVLIKDYCDFEQLTLQLGNIAQEDEYIKHLEKLFFEITPLFPSVDVVVQEAITVLFSEFLFSINQVKFGAKFIGLKKELYEGVSGFQEVLKLYQANPHNISKISFEIRTEDEVLDRTDVGKPPSKKLHKNNKPKTVSLSGKMLIPFLMNGALSELDKINEYEISSKQRIFKLTRNINDKEGFAIKNNLKPLFDFLIEKNVFKSTNATLSKIVELLIFMNIINFDVKGSRDEKTQIRNFIQVLYRVLLK